MFCRLAVGWNGWPKHYPAQALHGDNLVSYIEPVPAGSHDA